MFLKPERSALILLRALSESIRPCVKAYDTASETVRVPSCAFLANVAESIAISNQILHLELDARLLGMNCDVYGVERVHNSDLFDSVQKTGRLKSIKETCDRNNPIKFIRWLKKGKTVLYATDQDYGLNQSDVINFFWSASCNNISSF